MTRQRIQPGLVPWLAPYSLIDGGCLLDTTRQPIAPREIRPGPERRRVLGSETVLAFVGDSLLAGGGLLEASRLLVDRGEIPPSGERAWMLGSEPVVIAHGTRIAQMVLAPVTRVTPRLVGALSGTGRGMGGFGSTGLRAGGTDSA